MHDLNTFDHERRSSAGRSSCIVASVAYLRIQRSEGSLNLIRMFRGMTIIRCHWFYSTFAAEHANFLGKFWITQNDELSLTCGLFRYCTIPKSLYTLHKLKASAPLKDRCSVDSHGTCEYRPCFSTRRISAKIYETH